MSSQDGPGLLGEMGSHAGPPQVRRKFVLFGREQLSLDVVQAQLFRSPAVSSNIRRLSMSLPLQVGSVGILRNTFHDGALVFDASLICDI